MNNITFDTLKAEYTSDLAKLDKECFTVPWSENLFKNDVENKNSYYVIGLDGNTVISYGGMYIVLDEADITNIAVHPIYRCRGIASRMLDILINHCNELNIKKLMLEVRCSNKKAISLYQKKGFLIVGERKNYYSDNGETAILMTKYMEEVK